MKTKNLFLSMLAMASMLFATSCSQDELVNEPIADEYVSATFNIGATNGIGSRAVTIGTASKINWVACAIYDAAGAKMNLDQIVPFENGKATYNVRLAKGQDYRAVFFAYYGDANKVSSYYNLSDLTNIEIHTANSNIEERDAFTAYEPIAAADLTNKKVVDKTVTLYRPFAQLNMGIDDTEVEAAKKAGVEVAETKVVVSNVYNRFNAYENKAVVGSETEMTFDFNTIQSEKLVVNGSEYKYLSLNYLLVGDAGTEKTLTDVKFYWKNTDGSKYNNPVTEFINVSVQRNFRTNILGKLLTTPAEFTIEIDADFDGEFNKDLSVIATVEVADATALQTALDNAAAGGQTVIKLTNDITGNVMVTQKQGVDILIDGNSKKFTGILTTNGNGRQAGTETLTVRNVNFVAANGADACIKSPDREDFTPAKYSYSHNVTIDNCTFTDPDGGVNCAAVRHGDGGDEYWTIRNCKIDNTMHSIIQTNNVNHNLTIDGCTVQSKNGANLNCCTNVNINNCNFNVKGYAVRFGVNSGGNPTDTKTFSIANSTLSSTLDDPNDAVIMFRTSAQNATLTLTNTTVTGTTKVKGNTAETTINGLN